MRRKATSRVLAGVLLAGAALVAASAQAQAPIQWRFFTYFPTSDKPAQLTRAFAEDVSKATGGKLRITVLAAGELPYKAPDVLRAVATNQVQMADVALGFLAGDVPALNVMQLPFLCSSYAQFDTAIPAVAPVVDAALKGRFGVSVGVHWSMPPQNLWLNRPVSRIEDLKGLKIRAWNPEQVEMMRVLGGSAVSITSAEVIPALERKVIDGAITSALSADDWKAYEIIKTGYLLNMTMAHQVMLFNDAEFGKLPQDVREGLLETMKAYAPKYRRMSEDGDTAARRHLMQNKVKLIEPSAEDVQKARSSLRPMWANWAKQNGETGQKLLDLTGKACGAL